MKATADILKAAIQAARAHDVTTLVVASTTGRTALALAGMPAAAGLQIIVVTHSLARGGNCFGPEIERKLKGLGVVVFRPAQQRGVSRLLHRLLTKTGLDPWPRHIQKIRARHGTGIAVCYKILRLLKKFDTQSTGKIIAIAGRAEGADSAGIFHIGPGKLWPVLESVII